MTEEVKAETAIELYKTIKFKIEDYRRLLASEHFSNLRDPIIREERKRIRVRLSELSQLFEDRETHRINSGRYTYKMWIKEWQSKLQKPHLVKE